MVSLIGKLVLATVCLGVECSHHTDAPDFVFRVHIVSLVAKRCEIHTGTGAHTIHEGDDRLSQRAGIVDGLLIVVLCPSRTTWSIDDKDVTSAQRMIGRTDHHISVVDTAIRATAAISGDRTIHGEYAHEWEVLCLFIAQSPVATHLLTILGNLIFLRVVHTTHCIGGSYEAASLLRSLERDMLIQVSLESLSHAMHEVRKNHPLLLGYQFV